MYIWINKKRMHPAATGDGLPPMYVVN
jgi:hypothetical protein